MTTTVFLLRHAAHDNLGSYLAGRSPGVVLGSAGHEQAQRLGVRMRRENFVAIVSSPRERTQETAKAVSDLSRIGPIELRDELDEVDFGSWSGKTFDKLADDPRWLHWNNARASAETPAGESMEAVQRRVCSCMDTMARRFPDAAVVLVSHADVIKAAICIVLGLSTDHCCRFEIDPASISTVVMGSWGSKLLRLNEAS
jgi:broad specificity phosphatase PhoE